ncbi:hypothetical protein PIB30_023883 [Stylosanthes scabra]|uniref:Uncharacterized protein n=1 Tax=Stylosanthes scabra TaxID=79078 RepID=A0ABU6TAS5_9FABA|nr:hypothetical protein [Stylosanthes scabra]
MDSTNSIFDESYPYPTGFRPDLVLAHSHNDLGRAVHYPQIGETATENERASGDYSALRESPETSESSKIGERTVDEEERSDETLYKINKEAFRCGFGDDANEVVRETAVTSEWMENSTELGQTSVAVVANGDHRGPLNAGIGPTDQPIVSEAVAGNLQEDERAKSPLIKVWDEAGDELSDEEDSAEVNVARELWSSGGLSFVSSDEEEIVDRLTNRKGGGDKGRSKKFRRLRKPPSIQGRALATRMFRSFSRKNSSSQIFKEWIEIQEMIDLMLNGRVLSCWGVDLVWPESTKGSFESWMGLNVVKQVLRSWSFCFVAVIWTIWGVRNERIFNNKVTNVEEACSRINLAHDMWLQEWKNRN